MNTKWKNELLDEARNLYDFSSDIDYFEWFNDLGIMKQRFLFKAGYGIPFRKLNPVKYLPDSYYLVKIGEKDSIIRVRNNSVYSFTFGWVGSVEHYFKIKLRCILDGFQINESKSKLRIRE